MRPRELTFEDCRSTIEAETKLRRWLEEIVSDADRETVLRDEEIAPDLLDEADAANEAKIVIMCQLLRRVASGGKPN
jgi:hypothetical protein